MKPGFHAVNVFECAADESGSSYFTGTLDIKALKKLGRDEIRVVFITGDLLPPSLHSLMGKNSAAKSGLFMFAEGGPSEKRQRTSA